MKKRLSVTVTADSVKIAKLGQTFKQLAVGYEHVEFSVGGTEERSVLNFLVTDREHLVDNLHRSIASTLVGNAAFTIASEEVQEEAPAPTSKAVPSVEQGGKIFHHAV